MHLKSSGCTEVLDLVNRQNCLRIEGVMLIGKYIPQLVGDTSCPADRQVLVIVRMTIYPVLYVAVLDIVRQNAPLALLSLNFSCRNLKDGT